MMINNQLKAGEIRITREEDSETREVDTEEAEIVTSETTTLETTETTMTQTSKAPWASLQNSDRGSKPLQMLLSLETNRPTTQRKMVA
jgi:hypothetical protein